MFLSSQCFETVPIMNISEVVNTFKNKSLKGL